MSVRLTRRIAAELLNRGESAIRIKPAAIADAQKAITRDDVRTLIGSGSVYALQEKSNLSLYSKELREKRNQGRKRGRGRRKGTAKARGATLRYEKKVRGQRRVLAALKKDKTIDNEQYKRFYALVKGGNFMTKASLLGHIRAHGVTLTEERYKQLKHM
ncbi:MAG: 50S ribosomal protein L19e [Candidatus Micrarchaeota archaeon]|nr:50S ribosomal protein L19e [Candidatus Micrarchaeota archaeon]